MLLFCAIARGQTILVSYDASDRNFEAVASSMLKNIPRMQDTKCTYTSDNYLFHVLVENGITYMCTAESSFGKITPYAFLNYIKETFKKVGLEVRASTAGYYEFDREFSHVLSKEMSKASQGKGEGADKLTKMRAQVQEVTGIMTQNIEKVLERGEKLETLVDKAADLEANAVLFKGTSRKVHRKMRCKNIKCWLIIISIVLVATTLAILMATNVIPISKGSSSSSSSSSKKQ